MKVVLGILFAALSVNANQNLNYKVDAFVSGITKVRMETFNEANTPEQVKENVCEMLINLHFQALELQQEVLSERYPEQRRLKAVENVYKQTARTVMFCGDQSSIDENARIYNLGQVVTVLQNAGTLALSLKTEQLPDEGQINCDSQKDYLRMAIDPVSERIWAVRLNEEGQPETRLPYELRVTEMYVVSVSHYRPKGSFDIVFRLTREAPQSLEARVRNYTLNIFDTTGTEPEQTWENVVCTVKQ